MTLNVTKTIRKMMGWCPILNLNNYSTSHINSETSTTYNGTNPPILLPLFLKNTYVAGSRKEIAIGLFSILSIFILYHTLEYNSFFSKYGVELIMFSIVLLLFVISRSSVEIDNKYIRVGTIFQWIVGLTTHTLDSINTVTVQKKNNKLYRLEYWALFIIGILWLFRFFSDIYAGKAIDDLTLGLIWIVFCFGYGYIMYVCSKSVYHIQICFNPHPSINKLKIYTKDAPQIAEILEKANKHLVDTGVDDTK